ncbi:MAG: pyruvate dehydrogenase (acetyl-transferring), homodimeric type [Deltaproteobacteria bacterium]|nr:pyruvate dehydrogenase (acetyl-transferring), homodimeric type [Deltaproteobacteria bacterium]
MPKDPKKNEEEENQEWLESFDEVLEHEGPERARQILAEVEQHASEKGILLSALNTSYTNTISLQAQPVYPGDLELEKRIRSIIRWNAMAMVVRANKKEDGIGGHISSFASAATLYEVAFQHFFRGRGESGFGGDQIYFQGHASPGIYARAFLEGRLSQKQLENFRRELKAGGGLSSYPHPQLMPEFWEFPTVSMGLGPIAAIYQARFNRYLEARGLIPASSRRVWAFLGDGETDEPESCGAISLASREGLDNLIFVINCNLQRLDGPVRGNGKIIQELETLFRGAGWNVIKVIWGSDWDPLLEQDHDGLLKKRMMEVSDGQYQTYAACNDGKYIREHFFGAYPELLKRVEHLSDEDLARLRRGGHDSEKMYAAYKAAVEHKGSPTVILAKTIKGYGLGEAGEGKNVTHQQKKLNEEELSEFRTRFGIPISDEDLAFTPFYKPIESSSLIQYLQERRAKLGGYVPSRKTLLLPPLQLQENLFDEFSAGTTGRAVSTTMVFVRILSKLLRDPKLGRNVVPIVPDEARTFGMESLFAQLGIYTSLGQRYEPVDKKNIFFYREAVDGQILEEGINEAGAMASFCAAATAYSSHGVQCIPFYIFYSMFGFQRTGDQIWQASDMRARGFLLGATSGRTTLAGEGLQHQDGQSHLLAYPVPNLKAYDPAFAYELAVIIQNGMERMYEKQENVFYYITLHNENYAMPVMPEGVKEGILKGMYPIVPSPQSSPPRGEEVGINSLSPSPLAGEGRGEGPLIANLFGSGAILGEVLRASKILEEKFKIATKIWSITSYKELYCDAKECERFNLEHPEQEKKLPYLRQCLQNEKGIFVAASDYVRALPDSISAWFPKKLYALGTDGWGLSESRASLRRHFRVDAEWICYTALYALWEEGSFSLEDLKKAKEELLG